MGNQTIWDDLKAEIKKEISIKKVCYPDRVSDKTLKDAIVEKARLEWSLILFFTFGLMGLIVIMVKVFHVSGETATMLMVLGNMIIMSFFSFLIQREWKRRAAIFAEKYYKEAKLFRTSFVKVRQVCYGRGPIEYHLRMKDKDGRVVTAKILQSQYEAFKQDRPEYVYAIRLPKYKNGYFYMGYSVDTFENATSFLEEEGRE